MSQDTREAKLFTRKTLAPGDIASPSTPYAHDKDEVFFTSERALNPACFDAEAFRTMMAAAAEMQSLGDRRVAICHLFISLTRSEYFVAIFGRLTKNKGPSLALILKVLRALVRQICDRSVVGEGKVRELHHDDLSAEVMAVLRVARSLAHDGPITVKHLVVALLRGALTDLLRELGLGQNLTVSDLMTPSRPPPPSLPHPLFTPKGRLWSHKLAEGVLNILERGRGYGALQESEAFLTPGLFLALLDDVQGIASTALRAQGIKPEVVRQAICQDHSSGPPLPVMEFVCSERILRILRRAYEEAKREGSRVREVHLLRCVLAESDGPTIEHLQECGVNLDHLRTACGLPCIQ
jgi:hypothetical protein